MSIYPRATEEEDFQFLKELAQSLAQYLHATVIGIMVNTPPLGTSRSSCLRYVLYKDSVLVDEYSSNPGFPWQADKPEGGSAEALLPFCISGTTKRELNSLLHSQASVKNPPSGEAMVQTLAHCLNIPRAQISMGFNHLKKAQAER